MALTAVSAVAQYQAGKDAEAMADYNASLIGAEGEEEAYRMSREQEATRASARARAAASGVTGGGSIQTYLDEMTKTQARELDWLGKSTKSQQVLTRLGGDLAKKKATAQAIGTLGSAAGMGYSWFG